MEVVYVLFTIAALTDFSINIVIGELHACNVGFTRRCGGNETHDYCCAIFDTCCGDSHCCPGLIASCCSWEGCCDTGYKCCDTARNCCPEESECCGAVCCLHGLRCKDGVKCEEGPSMILVIVIGVACYVGFGVVAIVWACYDRKKRVANMEELPQKSDWVMCSCFSDLKKSIQGLFQKRT